MKKNYLAPCLAVMALGLTVAGCSTDSEPAYRILTEQEALENAETQLGFTIDPNQTWLMTKDVKASITFNGDYGTDNTALIYENNPAIDGTGIVLGQASVKSGQTAQFTFTAPIGATLVYAAIEDYLGYTYVKPVAIVDGSVTADFGDSDIAANAPRRSATNSNVNIPTCTVTDTYVKSFLTDAKEPTDVNVEDNYDNGEVVPATDGHWEYSSVTITREPTMPNFGWADDPVGMIRYNWGSPSNEDRKIWNDIIYPLFQAYENAPLEYDSTNKPQAYIDTRNAKIDLYYDILVALEKNKRSQWIYKWEQNVAYGEYSGGGQTWIEGTPGYTKVDETYVKKFKITDTWNKQIGVLATEKTDGDARTVYVSGKWTIPANVQQKVGGGAVIVVDNNGEIVVSKGAELYFVNQARLVVVGTGKITGEGSITVTNGVAEGEESYNSGTISVKSINQNFGTFFNYGTISSETLIGGAGTSCYVNHGLINIKEAYGNSNSAANLQIKNNCWFEASGDVACKIIENGANAYFKAKNITMSDGYGDDAKNSYMAVDNGSRVYATTNLSGNNTSIIGPTTGDYAYICVGGNVTNWNWSADDKHTGMIINNIYLYARPNSNAEWNWTHMINESVKESYADWSNSKKGNNNVTLLTTMDGYNTATTEASKCAPGFTPAQPQQTQSTYPVYTYAFEDTNGGDYDMNDVVIRAQEVTVDGKQKIKLTLVAVGAELDLNIRLYPAPSTRANSELAHYEGTPTNLTINGETEAHLMLGAEKGVLVNTGAGATCRSQSTTIDKGNYDPAHLPLAISSPQVSNHEMRLASGREPFGIIISGVNDWKWPVEYVSITKAYNNTNTSEGDQSFTKYGEVAGQALNWYKYPTENLVMNESSLGF